MNEPQNKQNQKWIALSVIILFALSGGVYQLAKHHGSAPDSGSTLPGNGGGTDHPPGDLTQNPNTNSQSAAGGGNPSLNADGSPAVSAVAPGAAGAPGAQGQGTIGTAGSEGIAGSNGQPGAPGSPNLAHENHLPGLGVPGAGAVAGGVPGTPGLPLAGGVPRTGNAPNVPIAIAPLPGAGTATEKPDQCVTITYHHKPSASHGDDESCSHHKNMLKLTQLGDLHLNAASVCVKVNGAPVHYLGVKGHAEELIFGAIAGPKSKVTVRYCTGKAQGCVKEDCNVAKDEFMEAIGGGDTTTQTAKLGQWDPEAPAEKEADVMAKLDGAVKKELETNDDLNGRAPAGELFKDWIGQAETVTCGGAQAKN